MGRLRSTAEEPQQHRCGDAVPHARVRCRLTRRPRRGRGAFGPAQPGVRSLADLGRCWPRRIEVEAVPVSDDGLHRDRAGCRLGEHGRVAGDELLRAGACSRELLRDMLQPDHGVRTGTRGRGKPGRIAEVRGLVAGVDQKVGNRGGA